MYLAPDLAEPLRAYDLDALDRFDVTAYALRTDWTIGYHSDGWDRFARGNGVEDPTRVWDPDRPALEAIPQPLRGFYEALYTQALESGEEQSHTYECSAPELFRRCRLRVIPLGRAGVLNLHHLTEERPMDRTSGAPDQHVYRDEHGMIVQCAQCRMVRRADGTAWDWVPDWVASAARDTSHGLCPVCFAHYYPQLAERYVKQRREKRRLDELEQSRSVAL